MQKETQQTFDFDAIRLKVASPEAIRSWSHGEVTKPETINYRTQKPEKDGLFDERIFGPTKDWECYCGKYKRIRYKGIICDKCGVEVTRSLVRRERMGHIELAVPISHIWFLRGVPSKIGLVLNLSTQDLEKVIYFASFVVTRVNEDLKRETLEQINDEFKLKKKQIEQDFQREVNEIKNFHPSKPDIKSLSVKNKEINKEEIENKLKEITRQKEESLRELVEILETAKRELMDLRPLKIISENTYQDLALKYGHVFEANIGAEAIRILLENLDLKESVLQLEEEIKTIIPSRQKKAVKRLKLLKSLVRQDIRPEWMILTILPVIPPDLRPMVQLDGGRFAASDLNDLYRRVINRNNRLKRLKELNAPEVICRNEKRMLQEAVDALLDNSARRGKTVTASTGQKRMLRSLADILKGKQGRFRQNLLGKRVDYSGRSVIVVGPHLKLHQCGIPKQMALELFKPFVISRLIEREYVHNVRSANRFIESDREEVWDILEEITKNSHILLNRAPTLHRLSIQAFQPILIEGKAIQIHPLICPPFNADFDGDQMAAHVPLTEEAKKEAEEIMLSAKNLLKPATGEPAIAPSQDLVLGIYYMTKIKEPKEGKMKEFSSIAEIILAYESKIITLQDKIKVKFSPKEKIETTVGRILFNQILLPKLRYINKVLDSKALKGVISKALELYGTEKTAKLLDDIKKISLSYLTSSGLSWSMDDLPLLKEKEKLLIKANQRVKEVQNQFEEGLLTEEERHIKIIEIWAEIKDKITELSHQALAEVPDNPIYYMIESGSRGSWAQTTQMIGMKGLVTNPAGETIELPVKGSFKEGFDVLEYFISTHGARKGLSDTALRTANAGYLTRRLIDASQDVVVTEKNCGDEKGLLLSKSESEEMGQPLAERVKGRVLAQDIKHPQKRKVLAKKGEIITQEMARKIEKVNPEQIYIRSILTCKAVRGVCSFCYGWDLGHNKLAELGTSVGIIAAQSIGEPGTQLTMRTFHTGGVAGLDITQGLPRVEEIFEARLVKKPALMAPIAGEIELEENETTHQRIIKIRGKEIIQEKIKLKPRDLDQLIVKDGEKIKKGNFILENKRKKITAPISGKVEISEEDKKEIYLKIVLEKESLKEFNVPSELTIWVKDRDLVEAGDRLTEGALDLHELFRLKGKEATQKYIIEEIQYIYSSQGQRLNDKHIEIIARQMFSRVYVINPGDTDLLPGETVEKEEYEEVNEEMEKKKKEKATGKTLLLGITKVSLSTSSFLSAASFQETARVLIDAAVTGKVDKLKGLKENVIIGRLIPAGTGFKKYT